MLELRNTPETWLVATAQDGDINASSTTTSTVWSSWLVQPPQGRGNKATTERGWRGFVMLSKCYKGFYCHLLGKCLTLDSDGVLLSWRDLSAGINQDLFYWRAGAWSQNTKQPSAPRIPLMSVQNHLSLQQRGSAGETAVQGAEVLMLVRLQGQDCCLQARMGQRLEHFSSHHTSCLHFTCSLFTVNARHPGASILAKRNSCSFAPRAQEEELGWSHQAWSVPPSQTGPIKPGQSHWGRLVPHKHTVISLFRQGWFRSKMRNQGPELPWSLRPLLFESTDAKLLIVHLNNVGEARIRPKGAPSSSSLPSLAPFWGQYQTCWKAASGKCRSAEL